MQIRWFTNVLPLLAAIVALAGCSAGGSTTGLPQSALDAGDRSPASVRNDPMLYAYENDRRVQSIGVYRVSDGSLVRRITAGVYGVVAIAIDRNGTTFAIEERIVQDRGRYRLVEYSRGSTAPTRTIQRGKWQPIAMAFDSRDDLLVLGRDSYVREFRPGAVAPYAVVSDGLDVPTAMTIDPSGTLYVANAASVGGTPNKGAITVYADGRRLVAKIEDQIVAPLGVALDGRGTLYVLDGIGTSATDYRPAVAQYATSDDRFLRSATVTQSPYAFVEPGFEADSLGNIYAKYGGCVSVGGATRCVSGINVYPPGATQPARVLRPASDEGFGSLAFDRAGNGYLVACTPARSFACEVRVYPPGGKPPRTFLRVANTTIGSIAVGP